jgi:hypothetical protein
VESIDSDIRRKVTPLGIAAAIAAPQHGVVARRQQLRAGLSRDVVDRMARGGKLILLYRGVYAVGHRPVGPRSREMAVVLLAGARGALGRESSAALWAMMRAWRGPVQAIGQKSRRGPGFVIHRTRNLPAEALTVHWGIPVTTPLRTLLDLSPILSLDALDAALAEALVRKLVRLEDLRPCATGKLGRLLETAAPTRSCLERDLRRLLRAHGLPQPISNGILEGYEVDLHWPDHALVAELDGYAAERFSLLLGRGLARAGARRRRRRPAAARRGAGSRSRPGRRARPGRP